MADDAEVAKSVEAVHANESAAKELEKRFENVIKGLAAEEIRDEDLAAAALDGDKAAVAAHEKALAKIEIYKRERDDIAKAQKAQGRKIEEARAKLHTLGLDKRRKEFNRWTGQFLKQVTIIEDCTGKEADAVRKATDLINKMKIGYGGDLPGGTMTSAMALSRAIAVERHRALPKEATINSVYPPLVGAAQLVFENPKTLKPLAEVAKEAMVFIMQMIEQPPTTLAQRFDAMPPVSIAPPPAPPEPADPLVDFTAISEPAPDPVAELPPTHTAAQVMATMKKLTLVP